MPHSYTAVLDFIASIAAVPGVFKGAVLVATSPGQFDQIPKSGAKRCSTFFKATD